MRRFHRFYRLYRLDKTTVYKVYKTIYIQNYRLAALYFIDYRKTKDLDNEIAILEEAIIRYRESEYDYTQIQAFEEQRKKAIEKLKKKQQD